MRKIKLTFILAITFFVLIHPDILFSNEAALKTFEEKLAKCETYDDYERFVTDVKNKAQDPAAKNADVLYYIIAKARLEELRLLSESNDIEAVRLYTTVSDQYYGEASKYIYKAEPIASSKDLTINLDLLKFLASKERFQPQKADEILERIAEHISSYSNEPSVNNEKLALIAEELDKRGLADYSLKLKISYAAKADEKSAQGVLEGIKRSADKEFAQGNTRAAEVLYDQYIKTGQKYFSKDIMAPKVMEIAGKYFDAGKYNEALTYYEFYKAHYPDSKILDWCDYRIALCYYNERYMEKAALHLAAFLDKYKESVWFGEAFEALARFYFANYPRKDAIEGLHELIDNYYRKYSGDYARILAGLLYYGDKEYEKALEELKKIENTSIYSYSAMMVIEDIEKIKKGDTPTFSVASEDTYKIWEQYSGTELKVIPEVLHLTVEPSAKVKFEIKSLEDLDKFEEYLEDRKDVSRLPRQVREGAEKDILSIEWKTVDGGKFVDGKQSTTKLWQAPEDAGPYKISLLVDDLGLVRLPDRGLRKDAARELEFVITVKEKSD